MKLSELKAGDEVAFLSSFNATPQLLKVVRIHDGKINIGILNAWFTPDPAGNVAVRGGLGFIRIPTEQDIEAATSHRNNLAVNRIADILKEGK